MDDNDRELQTGEILLIFEVAVDCEKDVKAFGCPLQQITIFQPGPFFFGNGALTSWPGSSLRSAPGTHPSSSSRIGNQMGLGLLEGRDGKLARNGREVVKELVEGMTSFDVVDERLHGNARADEYRGPAQDFRIRVDNRRFFHTDAFRLASIAQVPSDDGGKVAGRAGIIAYKKLCGSTSISNLILPLGLGAAASQRRR
jgi:hypothetical protein